MSNIVLKLGGHALFGEKPDTTLMKQYVSMLRETYDGGRWVVVVGGGEPARKHIEAARQLGLDEASCDEAAIRITRVNAFLFARALGEMAFQRIPEAVDEIRLLADMGRIVVVGGLQPGQSTMAVSVLAGSVVGAERIVVATDVDGIYSEDPKKNKAAQLIRRMRFDELAELAQRVSQRAGEYQIVDMVGLAMVLRTRIPLYYVNGRDIAAVRDAVLGRKAGTVVSD
ncbi:MAG: UMP kinase [Candidatus Caldarchaeum sp.]|nr:UMP kinase [Candidatus Caldarchaeum sp.]MDW7977231.1 UMP kinase [Candidatus Caldarchaeum sp.]